VQLFKAESNEVVDYNGGRTLDELKKFVLEHAGGDAPEAASKDDDSEVCSSQAPSRDGGILL
jgi:hypothetical protein